MVEGSLGLYARGDRAAIGKRVERTRENP